MDFSGIRAPRARGAGLDRQGLGARGDGTVIEDGARIIHPENVRLGANVFVGHDAYLDGYHNGYIEILDGTWIGQQCFLHGAGGLEIGRAVGLGPRVTVLTSSHDAPDRDVPVLHGPIRTAKVIIGDGADIGAAAVILPGVTIGCGAIVGAGSVVTRAVPDCAVVAGNPARLLRMR